MPTQNNICLGRLIGDEIAIVEAALYDADVGVLLRENVRALRRVAHQRRDLVLRMRSVQCVQRVATDVARGSGAVIFVISVSVRAIDGFYSANDLQEDSCHLCWVCWAAMVLDSIVNQRRGRGGAVAHCQLFFVRRQSSYPRDCGARPTEGGVEDIG